MITTLFFSISVGLMAQTSTHIDGKITDIGGEPLGGVNILVKGQVIGTVTDIDGNYSFDVRTAPPFDIIISMVGFESQEIGITDANTTGLDITLPEQMIMGQEVVISASRIEQSIMESPVSIEKMGILAIKNTASDSYYKGIANLKGVDMVTSSINFQIFNARGFNSTGNTRFVQLIDGMDTQAPALNFPIGSLNGPSDLDVESIEFLPGAASALYGPNAFNGILLINSKNPFDYQGLSVSLKASINHLGDSDLNTEDPTVNPDGESMGPGNAQPMYVANIRYAKAINNKWAFKLNFTYSGATDWYGTSLQDRNEANTPAGFSFNPGADRLHAFGDEVAINLGLLKASGSFNAIVPAGLDVDLLPSTIVSRTPYLEQDIVDYDAKNIKYGGGLFYRITDKIEVSYNYSFGGGTSVYTGAQRYSLKNFAIQSHKLEFRGADFFVRGYTTIENSGESYIADLTGVLINDSWRTNNTWFGLYGVNYMIANQLQGKNPEDSHNYARSAADGLSPVDGNKRLAPGTPEFDAALAEATGGVIPSGSKFADNTTLYHLEGQYNLKKEITAVDLLVGGSYQLYNLRSNGTIFPDTPDAPITISEYGAFVQASKDLMNRKLNLSGSLRFDKNENFDGQINPRLSAVVKPAEGHNIRLSFQTGFRNPTTQGQHIDLNVVSARLLGGLKPYRDKHDIFTNAYSMASVNAYVAKFANEANGDGAQLGNPEYLDLLVPYSESDVPEVIPEQITSFEVGYKALINNKLMLDIVGYYNLYNDFITQVQMRKAAGNITIPTGTSDNPADANFWGYQTETEQNIRNAQSLLTPITTQGKENTFQTYTNFNKQVVGAGAAIGADYMLGRGYIVGGNYNWNKLLEGLDENFLNDFNTPEHKINVSFSNRKVTDKLGFNVAYRWQTSFRWEASFGRGEVPAIGTVDAQLSYKLSSMRSVLKVGGSNLLNTRHVLNYGGPTLGAIYYVSLTFDELLN